MKTQKTRIKYFLILVLFLGLTTILSGCSTQAVPKTKPLEINSLYEYNSSEEIRSDFQHTFDTAVQDGTSIAFTQEGGVRQGKGLAFAYGSNGVGTEFVSSTINIEGITNQHIYFSFWYKGTIENLIVKLVWSDGEAVKEIDVSEVKSYGGYVHVKITDVEAGKKASDLTGFAIGYETTDVSETGTFYLDDFRFTEEVLPNLTPIVFDGGFFDKFFVYPVGMMLKFISDLFGGLYAIGIIFTTIIIRTLAWPIYAKTNDMTLKMQIMQPEQAKLQEKYAGRQDPESQRMMQMETLQLYKKYKVGIGGCLLPFLQMPIFLSIYNVIRRAPDTWSSNGNFLTKVLGVDLFLGQTDTAQKVGIWILALLVVATQLLMQWLMMKRQKKLRNEAQSDVPDYRKKQTEQTQNIQKQTQMMMYFMTLMMAVFVLQSPAGLGFYWLIGNIYSAAQTYIGQKFSDQRMLKLMAKHK